MKRNYLCALCSLLLFIGCSDDDNSAGPNEAVTKAFNEKYPTASQISWENKNSYATADFVYNQQKCSAWFNQQGQWYMTETELDNIALLPETVRAAFSASEYANWITDDIDRLDRLDAETIYVIEVKKDNRETDLYYSTDGVLIKAIQDNNDDDYENYLPSPEALPAAISTFITTKYPDARIVEVEKKNGITEVEIIHEKRGKEVRFNIENTWLDTHYDVFQNEVEHTVTEALSHSEYAGYAIDEIEKYETSSEYYYLFELEQGNLEVNIKIDQNGNLSLIK